MLIFSPYSRRKDEQLQSILKFSGPRNNLKEIITGFFQKRPRGLTQSVSLTEEWGPRQRWKESCTPVNQYWLFYRTLLQSPTAPGQIVKQVQHLNIHK